MRPRRLFATTHRLPAAGATRMCVPQLTGVNLAPSEGS
jgi:hypothetical protein